MSTRGTGLTLSIGILAAIVGYILWQVTVGFNTKADDIATILQNSASGSTSIQIALILIAVGLVVHAAGLINTRGTAASTSETLGINCIISAIVMWIATSGLGAALAEMGEKYVAASAGAAAGDAASVAAVGGMQIAAGFIQATSVASGNIGALLAGIGWLFIGIAYLRKGASLALLGWLSVVQGLILIVSILIISTAVSVDTAQQINGIGFLLITVWSVIRGVQLINSK